MLRYDSLKHQSSHPFLDMERNTNVYIAHEDLNTLQVHDESMLVVHWLFFENNSMNCGSK